MSLTDVEQMLAAHQPSPDPFNGATKLVLAPGVMAALKGAIEPWVKNTMMGRSPEIEVRPTLPDGHGYGFRPWRDGDDPEMRDIPVVTWVLAPKSI